MDLLKRLFGKPAGEKGSDHQTGALSGPGAIPEWLETKLQHALADANKTKSEARNLTAERVRPILASVVHGVDAQQLASAIKDASPLPTGYWSLIWPLIEAATSADSNLDSLAAAMTRAPATLADQGDIIESFGIYAKSNGRQKEVPQFTQQVAQHADQCSQDACELGRAAMVLCWLGKVEEARSAFLRALHIAKADNLIIEMVGAGEVIDSWYPMSAEVKAILAFWQRANLASAT